MILKHREDIPQIFLTGIGPIILISATAIETLTSLNSFLIWGIVWLLICRNNYVLHNHVHSPMFTSKRINRLCNIIFGLTAGMPAGNWKIMHVHGHHVEHRKGARQGRKYIERFIIPDDTRDSFWNFFKYAIRNTLPQMFIPFRELLKMAFGPKFRRAYGRYYLLDYLIIGLFLLAVFVFSPKSAAIIIYFYVIITFFSLRTDYSTHVGEKAKGDILFANNCQDAIFNRFFWNFGHHVGHHMKPSLHWTKLPAYEKKLGVVDSEGDVQTVSFNFFGLLLPPFLHWRATRRIES